MPNATFTTPIPRNEHVYNYAPGCDEVGALNAELQRQSQASIDIPAIVGSEEIFSGPAGQVYAPHDHSLLLATYRKADRSLVTKAIEQAMAVRREWMNTPFHDRAAIFLKAADLVSTKYRQVLNAATMLGQSKNVYQAEIDSACELIDFLRFNIHYAEKIYATQPEQHSDQTWNRLEYRPLEGFVFAVTPFNFTSIGGNLPMAPAIMGNVVLWKPSSAAVLSNYYIMKVFKEAGLPDGVINFVPGNGAEVGDCAISSPHLAGLHFTGSTDTFDAMWLSIARNISAKTYKGYPRIVGETGGKNFFIAHPDCNVRAAAVALFRGAFEYQGQKCSATSRAYIARSIWPEIRELLLSFAAEAKVGNPADLTTFMGAVIDEKSFRNISSYIAYAAANPDEYHIVAGGTCDSSVGWFIPPTIVETTNPKGKLMTEEIFGPVLTVYVYNDEDFIETLELIDSTSRYGLTGSIFANDRKVIAETEHVLTESAGNFYINDKSTGAVVGQQAFGGARASGTNDKAGSEYNLMRWTSVRTIKENFLPPETWDYPHQRIPKFQGMGNIG